MDESDAVSSGTLCESNGRSNTAGFNAKCKLVTLAEPLTNNM